MNKFKTIVTNVKSLEMKTCSTCHESKPLEGYPLKYTINGGKKGRCKACISSIYGHQHQSPGSYKQKADFIISLIYEHFDKAGIDIGDKITSESKLATELGISNSSLREALGILQYNGHMRTVWGSGRILISKPTTPTS